MFSATFPWFGSSCSVGRRVGAGPRAGRADPHRQHARAHRARSSATAQIHKIVGEIYVEQLNKRGGLLGRQVEWVLKDDQSKPDLARTLYEQLVTADKVDLLMGPYATGAILSAMGVAQRYDKVLVHHTFGIPSLAKYEQQFPAWSLGPDPANTRAEHAVRRARRRPEAAEDGRGRDEQVPVDRTSCPPARARWLKKRGLKEVLFLEWDFGNRDFGPIANRVKDAKPDFVWVGAIGLDGNLLLDAMKKIDYVPPQHFYLYPAPGPLVPLPEAKNALSVTIFEDQPPFTANPGAAEFVKALPRARHQGRPARHRRSRRRPRPRTPPGRSSRPACVATKSLDDKAIAAWLKANRVDTIQGKLRFNGAGNFGDDLMRIKQVQNGKWVVGLAEGMTAGGAKLLRQLSAARAACRDSRCRAPRCSRRASSRASSSARCTACWGWASACAGACCG